MKRLNIISFLLFSLSGNLICQITTNTNVFILSDSLLKQQPVIINTSQIIRYNSGDNAYWAKPEYTDSSWTTYISATADTVSWFRFYLEIDSDIKNTIIAINGYSNGQIKIFLNGLFICDTLMRYPLALPQMTPGKHLFALRFKFRQKEHAAENAIHFFIQFSDFNKSIKTMQSQRSEQMVFVSLPLAFALLHLILFIFLPSARANLYYTLFLILIAVATYADIHSSYLADYTDSHLYLLIHRFFVPLAEIALLLFLYKIFYDKIPKQFWLFCIAFLIVQVLIINEPQENYHYFVKLDAIRTLEIFRVITVAIYKKKDGAVIFAIGVLILFIFSLYDALLDMELMAPVNEITNAYYFGLIGLFIATTIFLSRDFARSNKKIVEQENHAQRLEFEKKLLQAEEQRKSKELEEARLLQISMLPRCLNNFPGLDVCFSLIPATEVGGDYYDFHRNQESLTIVIGDATGHGMKAGMMVSIIKSMFVSDIKDSALPAFMNKASNAIKQMKLGHIYMALQLLRIEKNKITIASAGMPPVYIYRVKTTEVEEIKIKAMPLGSPVSAPFKEIKSEVNAGDVILMLSDGLPEVFNADREMPDYPLVIAKFKESIHKSADEIVADLINFGNEWRQEFPQHDDITAIVIKFQN